MALALSSIISSAKDLLELEVEEVAGVLLHHLLTRRDLYSDDVVQHGKISENNFFNEIDRRPPYQTNPGEVKQALLEAWNWLQREGFLIRDPHNPSPWFYFSRRALRLESDFDIEALRKATLLPRSLLHPLIVIRVQPAFIRGEYDTAVFQAFREIEIAVREGGNFPQDFVGTQLMRDAFRPFNPKKPDEGVGPLTDSTLPLAEQEGLSHLFAGAISVYKNPQSHRTVSTSTEDAVEILMFASQLLKTVDRLRESKSRIK